VIIWRSTAVGPINDLTSTRNEDEEESLRETTRAPARAEIREILEARRVNAGILWIIYEF